MEGLPDITVLTTCVEALPSGVEDVARRVTELGFVSVIRDDDLERIEMDYFQAIHALEGRLTDSGYLVDLPPSIDPYSKPDLTSAIAAEDGGTRLLFRGPGPSALIALDNPWGSSCVLLSSQPWADFSDFFTKSSGKLIYKFDEGSVRTVAYEPEAKEASFLEEALWRIFPSTYPDEVHWEVMQVDSDGFEALIGRESHFEFSASYHFLRWY